MKTPETDRILIAENKDKMNFQRIFISRMASIFTELLHEFDAIVTQVGVKAHFDLTDIDRVLNLNALSFIKSKILPTIKDPQIAGVKSTPEKVFSLMDIPPLSSFTECYDRVIQEVTAQRQRANQLNLTFSLQSNYFVIEDKEVKVDEDACEEWMDKFCRTFADSDNQKRAWTLMNNIADALNELRTMRLNPNISGASTAQEVIIQPHQSFFLKSVSRFVKLNPDSNRIEPSIHGFINYL